MLDTRPQASSDSPRAASPSLIARLRRGLGVWLGNGRHVFAAAVVLALCAFALAGWIVVSDHRETRLQADAALVNIANALERDIARNVDLYNLTLQETIDSLKLPGLAQTNPELRHAALFDRIAAADYMASISVIDAGGAVVAESDSLEPRDGNVADRTYFEDLRESTSTDLYISTPLIGRVSKQPVLVFARRLTGSDGSFAGVVAGSVKLAYYERLFSTLDLGQGGAVSLMRTDGVILARKPALPTMSRSAESPRFAGMVQTGGGLVEGASTIDGVERITAYRQVGSLPLIVTASYGQAAVFAAWRVKSVLILSAFAVLVGVAAALLVALYRQLVRRAEAERRALVSADQARWSERALAHSLQELDAVFQFSADIHYAASRRPDGQFAFDLLNRRGEEITGLDAAAMIGRTPEECLPAEAAETIKDRWQACLDEGQPISYEHSLMMPSGRSHWETRLVPVHDTTGAICRLIGTTRDVTNRKESEAALLNLNSDLERRAAAAAAAHDDALVRASAAERLQLLGQLASGIAHDVNNVLQSVASCASLIERRAHEPETMQRAARLIADAAARGGSITHRLLAFSRAEAAPTERIRLAPLMADLIDLLRHTLRSGGPIEFVEQVEDDTLTVFAETNELETVLLNLATNARDAMPDGGTLILGASGTATPPSTLPRGSYVRIWVQDDGIGMDAATLARVTEPFFTTKPVGQGTGLGLSMADSFAQRAGGRLVIASRPGEGTTVDLWLRC